MPPEQSTSGEAGPDRSGRPASLVVVTGGTRSGKSAVAEGLLDPEAPVVYVATGTTGHDPEMVARVAAHRDRRPATWRTEETDDVTAAVARAPGDVLVDSVGTWVQARMDADGLWEDGDLGGLATEAAGWLAGASGTLVVVAEQVGDGLLPLSVGARRWVDAVGMVTQRLSAAADRVLLVVAGRVLELPVGGTAPWPTTDLAATPPAAAPPAAPEPAATTSATTSPATSGGHAGADSAGQPGSWSAPDDPETATAAADGLAALGRHGDTMVPEGALDLAVNVRAGAPPAHVRRALAAAVDTRYPDPGPAVRAVAGHTGLREGHVVLLAGAAEAFWLLPHALRPRHAAVVHPTFTAPEAALRACDVRVTRVPRDAGAGWALDPDRIPDDADMVVLGNPNNPTGTLDEPSAIAGLCRPGRLVVVDEAFMDFVIDGRSSLAGLVADRGLVVVRSVTKMWSVPGLRAGYLLAPEDVAGVLRRHQQPWPVSAAAVAVIAAAVTDEAWRVDTATGVARRRQAMVRRLRRIDGVIVHDGAANFVLLEVASGPAVHRALLARGVAVRPSTFPLLPPRFLRVAVQDADATERLATALEEVM